MQISDKMFGGVGKKSYLCTRNSEMSWLYRGVEQLVARQAHNLEVACSSPAAATNDRVRSWSTTSYPFFYAHIY